MEQVELNYIDDLMDQDKDLAWTVKDDGAADWAVEKVLSAVAERDRLVAIADMRIKGLQVERAALMQKYDKSTQFLTAKLRDYFMTVKTKDTTTQKKYPLFSGTLVLKHQQPEFAQDVFKLSEWVEENAPDFLEVQTRVKWGELKKKCTVSGEQVIYAETGEVVQGIAALAREDVFEITAK